MAAPRKRPLGVAVRACIVVLVGAALTFLATVGVLAAIAAVGLGLADARILLLAFSIVVFVAGIGPYNLRPWAWLAVVALALQLLSVLARQGVE